MRETETKDAIKGQECTCSSPKRFGGRVVDAVVDWVLPTLQ